MCLIGCGRELFRFCGEDSDLLSKRKWSNVQKHNVPCLHEYIWEIILIVYSLSVFLATVSVPFVLA